MLCLLYLQVKDLQKMAVTSKKEQDNDEDENKNSNNKRIQALEAACQEKEDVIQHLEQQLNEQVCAIITNIFC